MKQRERTITIGIELLLKEPNKGIQNWLVAIIIASILYCKNGNIYCSQREINIFDLTYDGDINFFSAEEHVFFLTFLLISFFIIYNSIRLFFLCYIIYNLSNRREENK